MQSFFSKIWKRKKIAAVILILLLAGGYFGFKKFAGAKDQTRYVLASVERGTLVTSISGTGQVSASGQVELKAKSSGSVIAVLVKKGQTVKAGAVLAQIDASEAIRSLNKAENAFETAKIELADLTDSSDQSNLIQAQNSVAAAKRSLEKAYDEREKIKTAAEQSLVDAYDAGFNDISDGFLKMPAIMEDLKAVIGTDSDNYKNIGFYKILLGSGSIFIERLMENYENTVRIFDKNFMAFKEVERPADREVVYGLISQTLASAENIYQTLQDSRNTLDASVNSGQDYKRLTLASYIDSLRPKILADISSINSIISSLQKTKNSIDNVNQNTPVNLKNADYAVEAAQENLKERELSLEKARKGPDQSSIKSKELDLKDKEDAVKEARQNLADTAVRAPFDGIVAEITVQKGDDVSSGIAIATVITKLQIAEISLNEVDMAKVKEGQKANLSFDALDGLNMTGKITEIDTLGTVSQGVVSYGVKIIFDAEEPKVKPGMSASVSIITEVKQDVLLIPNSAVKAGNNSNYVEQFQGKDASEKLLANMSAAGVANSSSSVERIQIETGQSNDEMTEVVGGLKEGDIIIARSISAQTSAQGAQNSQNGFFLGGSGAVNRMQR